MKYSISKKRAVFCFNINKFLFAFQQILAKVCPVISLHHVSMENVYVQLVPNTRDMILYVTLVECPMPMNVT